MTDTLPEEEWPATFSGTSWVTPLEVEELWPEAAELEWPVLDRLIKSSWEQCSVFAPDLPEGQAVPESWKVAQVMQARSTYRASLTGSNNQVGDDGMVLTVFPLDWQVRQLLRPKRGRYAIR